MPLPPGSEKYMGRPIGTILAKAFDWALPLPFFPPRKKLK